MQLKENQLIGHMTNPPRVKERVGMKVTPAVRKRVRDLLFQPEMFGVGYSEFIDRACEAAEKEIAQERAQA